MLPLSDLPEGGAKPYNSKGYMFTLLKIVASTSLCAVLLLLSPISQAATVNYNFTGAIDSGLLTGETYTGSFAFDHSGLTGSGNEDMGLTGFYFNFLSTAFNLRNADFTPTANFLDGVLLGLTYADSSFNPKFAFVSAAGTGSPNDVGYFSYDTLSGDSGFGSFVVDGPDIFAMFALGMVGLSLTRRRAKEREVMRR
jgi:hypothetical protein